MKARRLGFTLVELLVVVAILGILVSLAMSNLLGAIQRARQKRTMSDMRTVALGVEAYATDLNRYPASAAFSLPSGLNLPVTPISSVQDVLEPTYIKKVPLMDAWGQDLRYAMTPPAADYGLRSYGADQQPETSPTYGATTSFNADIILVDGMFVQFPDGPQR